MSKNPIDPNAVKALNQMKYEIANELGITHGFGENKGTLSAGQNVFFGGYVGGHMTKKLVEIAEKQLINKK
ncbi:alpha/beta-type small acid-soluble spore protein [Crassaminicella thermophila]|uniref:Alpha/beta-type small acid-soluble spore protein n=1 Tax=Crassaminicella thermophila TaxID=2599308 RepID=A0A5C0SB06_CRATE|nr:alpha/beta-type small acid-soluble spore protein [Crassaminicella thermophila]QEK11230.1 alpha/beta-type small acid-soluble spore protein [Crassaminicella thermophila]